MATTTAAEDCPHVYRSASESDGARSVHLPCAPLRPGLYCRARGSAGIR